MTLEANTLWSLILYRKTYVFVGIDWILNTLWSFDFFSLILNSFALRSNYIEMCRWVGITVGLLTH